MPTPKHSDAEVVPLDDRGSQAEQRASVKREQKESEQSARDPSGLQAALAFRGGVQKQGTVRYSSEESYDSEEERGLEGPPTRCNRDRCASPFAPGVPELPVCYW